MAKMKGYPELLEKFKDMRRKGGSCSATVIVGAPYAKYVHEMTAMKLKGLPRPGGRGRFWDPQGKATAKFLSKASAELRPQLQSTIKTTLKRGLSLWQAITLHATRVMKLMQKKMPVNTGFMKASAYVETKKK